MRSMLNTLSVALLALAAFGLSGTPAQAQEPTGTITGRVFYERNPDNFYYGSIVVVPADLPQPIPFERAPEFFHRPDEEGNYTVSGLADGDYLLGLTDVNSEFVPTMQERIWMTNLYLLPALRVSIQNGETVTVDVAIQLPDFAATPPRPTPTPPPGTGGISGRIVVEGRPNYRAVFAIKWVPADAPQPLDSWAYVQNQVNTDEDGNFTISALPAGEYFLLLPLWLEGKLITPPTDTVSVRLGGVVISLPAWRITIAPDRTIRDFEIVVRIEPPPLAVDFPPLSPAASLPSTGAGGGGAADAAGYIGPAVGVIAVMVLAGGMALGLREARRSRLSRK